ncbi:MAG: bifunctional metallophosphatase/5'-nucleotidase [Chloroflexota bacterium]|nr:bifunctional metallophosphatase/5'-nucleotidase [Chloroflexota bacterium]
MHRVIILHTNDIHGRTERLARVATLVERVRGENPGTPVLYFDGGDVEESSVRLSNITKGAAMHRLLSAAGCDAAAVGNAAATGYGPQSLVPISQAARYPLVLANLRTPDGSPIAGVQPTALLDLGILRLGVIGLTAWMWGFYEKTYDLVIPETLPLVSEMSAALRQDGADAVIMLSHMGLKWDRELAAELLDIPLVIGAHTHDLLPEGERVGETLVVQAGQYAEHLGRVDLTWDGERLTGARATVMPVTPDILASPRMLSEMEAAEADAAAFLDEVIGELAQPLDWALNRECGVGNLAAQVLRERMDADVGIASLGAAFSGPLPAGPLRRGTLWDVCFFPTNPGVVTLSGSQLAAVIRRGRDPVFALDRPRTMRGNARGMLHLSGASEREGELLVAGEPVDAERAYRVAGTDWELEPYGGYVQEDWALQPRYEMPTILREAVEEYVARHTPVRSAGGHASG